MSLISEWRDEGELDPEKVASSDIQLKDLRRKMSGWSDERKINYAHRLATQSHCKGEGRATSDKLLTVISRIIKLQRSVDNYREMLELKREKEADSSE
ncbi:MAG: hypothetical protein ABEK04_02195 [Candidatus Nanohalobium sp.]